MNRHRLFLVICLLGLAQATAQAGLFSKKPSKPEPKDRVPELLVIVKTDKDEHKRAAAATELRQYDPAAFPDIVPILIDVLMSDAKPAVRCEAAESLGKLRPVSKQAGWALEQALEKDSSTRVRMQARYTLLQYHWAGYKGSGKDAAVAESKEPPLAPGDGQKPIATSPSRKQQKALKPGGETPAPPLAPLDSPPPSRPAPAGTNEPSLVPTQTPPLKPPPTKNDGPRLDPDD
jgi:hypothetical protein